MDAELYLRTYRQEQAVLARERELRRAIEERVGTPPGRPGRAARTTAGPAAGAAARPVLRRAVDRVTGWAGRRHGAAREAAPSAGCCAPA